MPPLSSGTKSTKESTSNAVVLLTRHPHRESIDFYRTFSLLGYDVFVCADDTAYAARAVKGIFSINVREEECIAAGFKDFNPAVEKTSGCSAWDKSLLHFACINTIHRNIWFIEEDVFIPRVEIIHKLDQKYAHADIIGSQYEVNESGSLTDWPWWRSVPRQLLPPPWARSMVSAVRLSRPLLDTLNNFVKLNRICLAHETVSQKIFKWATGRPYKYRKAPFIEYIFHTLAIRNHLEIICSPELSGINWRRIPNVSDMDECKLYHPVKNIVDHPVYRKIVCAAKR